MKKIRAAMLRSTDVSDASSRPLPLTVAEFAPAAG
jgi:hypothetical protein